MRVLSRCLRIVCFGLLALPLVCLGDGADESGLTPEIHPWGRFHKGAWKRYRVVTESLDDNGQVVNTSVTETKTSLEDVGTDSVTLRVEATMEIAGKRLPAEPKTVRQSVRAIGRAPRSKFDRLARGK